MRQFAQARRELFLLLSLLPIILLYPLLDHGDLARGDHVDWACVAADGGGCDQSHTSTEDSASSRESRRRSTGPWRRIGPATSPLSSALRAFPARPLLTCKKIQKETFVQDAAATSDLRLP
jgi:hypothetical protein